MECCCRGVVERVGCWDSSRGECTRSIRRSVSSTLRCQTCIYRCSRKTTKLSDNYKTNYQSSTSSDMSVLYYY